MRKANNNNRRDFIKKMGLSSVPFLLPTAPLSAGSLLKTEREELNQEPEVVNFIYDGFAFSPQEYIQKLQEINKTAGIKPDVYMNGGVTETLEEEFAKLSGKEKAIYLPTGTMANQLAIKLLSGNNTKVIVPENSHIFRDEADAAQSVHNKRLVPVGMGKPYFDLEDLKNAVAYIKQNEVFHSGIGAVVIENPVRRAGGKVVPLDTIKEISGFCRENGYKLHLDGARIHLASAYTGVSLEEYSSYFDTVYISLYKYLHTTGGAILCGDAEFIEQIPHQIKIHGGTVYQSWPNTAVALHYLEGINERLKRMVVYAKDLIIALNEIKGVAIAGIENGTNIYELEVAEGINAEELTKFLNDNHKIKIGRPNDSGAIRFAVNESLLNRDLNSMVSAWKSGIARARV